ncbi:sensor histidine kinase [Prauserella flavalba]|uniref:Oxygen sensor histidine kinase NreB n=1 Tax=Prauserella flavalba TaxID=1477506 RepID=A0A318LKP5_9PSEU|nr:sensor histidine kinase [Prauserella flavalba]PXY34037.1 two-component sensor histidine kinase [Prauserella flavalba]
MKHSIEAELREEFDRWERGEAAVFQLLPYFLLAISTLVTLSQPAWGVPVHVPTVVALTVATTLWLLWFHTLHPDWHGNTPLMALYYAVLTALTAVLVWITPWFGFFAFAGYPQAFVYLKGHWRYAGVAATALISAVAYMGGMDTVTLDATLEWLAISLISVLIAGTLFHFAELTDQRNHRQKRALAELHEANVRLEAALEENAGLHAQLLAQAREAGVLDERQRMAREIHDTLAQGLAGILAQLQAAEQGLGEAPGPRRHVTNAMDLARESLTEARRTVHAVEPAVLAEARLPDAIGDVARRWAEVNHVDAALTTTGDARPLHADVEVALLRTAQEALTNVAKHAGANRVGLTLSYMADVVTLDVRDDGVGFDPDVRRANGSADGGFGLAGMRQRVRRLAGRLVIESEPGGGTAISATVPAIPPGDVD